MIDSSYDKDDCDVVEYKWGARVHNHLFERERDIENKAFWWHKWACPKIHNNGPISMGKIDV